ncbi:MAG: glutathione-regulated potassium-efflux system protein KefC [Gammaproteobacteria bacterium]|nr:glutathione-regulated potassium-efflux system protein KefC [Gammaproteobacteria bacterium]
MEDSLLFNVLIYLSAAVLAVPLAKRLGMGSILGYLIAGVVIGPWGFGIISNVEDILHLAEFGVVLLLFIIGLELNPTMLWNMRKPIFGLGGSQVLITMLVLFGLALLAGFDWRTALISGMAISLSSTAIALQIMTERNFLSTDTGNKGFAILLFQDVAVIPMLAIMPLLSGRETFDDSGDVMIAALEVIGVIALIIIVGRSLLRPLLRIIAKTQAREIFTAFSLMLVIGISLLMQSVNMSMALGAFLAGVLLADSEYRHQLETDVEPFKGLLLGLFFIAVGMSINFGLFLEQPWEVLGIVAVLVIVKLLIFYTLARISGITMSHRPLFSFILSQGGEFAFVIFAVANSYNAMNTSVSELLVVSVAFSMLITPLLILLYDHVLLPRYTLSKADIEEEDTEIDHNTVIIAGFGRFGQIIARVLHANQIPTTIIDHNPDQIEQVRNFGFKVFYGDVRRKDLLETAGAHKARLLILAVDDREAGFKTIEICRNHFPELTILARSWDLIHHYQLKDKGVDIIERETFHSAVRLAEHSLRELGWDAHHAHRNTLKFTKYDEANLERLYEVHKDRDKLISLTQEAKEEIERIFAEDEHTIVRQNKQDKAWG